MAADRQTDRASNWSITINNPKEEDYKVILPAGWTLEGQIEQGEEGTLHFQGYLKTNQVRFSAVKKIFPRAHIEAARNVQALQNYVHKTETRVSEVATQHSTHVSMFDFMHILARMWNDAEFDTFCRENERQYRGDMGEIRLGYVDTLVGKLIVDEQLNGIEYIGVNPMFRNAWKRYGASIILRERALMERAAQPAAVSEEIIVVEDRQTDRQEDA